MPRMRRWVIVDPSGRVRWVGTYNNRRKECPVAFQNYMGVGFKVFVAHSAPKDDWDEVSDQPNAWRVDENGFLVQDAEAAGPLQPGIRDVVDGRGRPSRDMRRKPGVPRVMPGGRLKAERVMKADGMYERKPGRNSFRVRLERQPDGSMARFLPGGVPSRSAKARKVSRR